MEKKALREVRELYRNKKDAHAAAAVFAREHGADIRMSYADSKMDFDYEDASMMGVLWSGEINAFLVEGDGVCGRFAYWDWDEE